MNLIGSPPKKENTGHTMSRYNKKESAEMEAIGILEGWVKQGELPVSWQLDQQDRRVHCFLEWLSSLTDSESLVVLNEEHQVIADWQAKDELLTFLQNPAKPGWMEESMEDDTIIHGGWIATPAGDVALGMISSVHIDKEFLGVVSEMLKTVIS